MPVRSLLRWFLLLCAGALAAVVAVQMATTRSGSVATITPWSAPPSPPATAAITIPVPGSPAGSGANGLPDIGRHINDETGSVARGQMSILDELEKAIADQIRGIIRRAEGH